MIKAIFFDFDGVLIKIVDDVINTCKILSSMYGVEYELLLERYYSDNENMMTGKMSHMDFAKKFDYPFLEEDYFQAFTQVEINSGVFDIITEMKKKGYLIGLITDNCVERMSALSKGFGFKEVFEFEVVAGDVGFLKHEIKPFEIALERSKLKAKECIFVDDNLNNIEVAEKVGFWGVNYNSERDSIEWLNKEICKIIEK